MSLPSQKMLSSLFLRSTFRKEFTRILSIGGLSNCRNEAKLLLNYSTHTKSNTTESSEKKIINVPTSTHQTSTQIRDLQPKPDHNPDTFGDLANDFGTKFDFVEKIPDEEGDVEEKVIYKRKRLSTNQYGKIIKKFLEKKKLGNAIDVLETRMLKEDKVEPEKYIYNLLISACANFGHTKKAFQLFNNMKKRGLSPSAATYTSLFNACANCPYPMEGLKRIVNLREIALEKGFVFNHLNYHAMIKAYGRCGSVEDAFKVVDEMIDNKLQITQETFNFLLQACASDKEAGFRHSLLVWRKMLVKGRRPDLFGFNLMLRCTRDCGIGNIETTKDVIKTILNMIPGAQYQVGMGKPIEAINVEGSSSKLPSNTVDSIELTADSNPDQLDNSLETTGNLPNLLARYPHLGDMIDIGEVVRPEHRLILIGGCGGFLKQMDLNRVVPNIKTFTLLLETIPPTISSEKAILKEMSDRNVMPDIDFFNLLIKKRSMRRDYQNAKAVLKNIRQHSLTPDIVTFGVLSLGCTKLEEAMELKQSIDDVGFRLNIEILGGLLKQACVEWDCDYVLFVMKVLVEEGITPSPEFIETVRKFHYSVTGFIKNENMISRKPRENQLRYLEKVKDEEFLYSFKKFSNYYNKFKVKVLVDVPKNAYEQFKKHDDPEDIELMNTGRS